jgi:hypothetical protein
MVNAIGEEVGNRMMKDPKSFQRFLQTASPGYRDAAKMAVASKDQEALNELLRTYLSQKTIFNYDRPSMSEFARSLGPMFGAFMRFPTEAIGDAVNTYARKDIGTGDKLAYFIGKYGAPLSLGALANSLLFGDFKGPGKKDDEKDTKGDVVGRAFLGQQGFIAPAFATSILNMLDEGYSPSPLMSVPASTVRAAIGASDLIMSDDDEVRERAQKRLGTATGDMLSTFGPGAGLLLLLNDTAKMQKALKEGELPEEGLGAQKSLPKQWASKLFLKD